MVEAWANIPGAKLFVLLDDKGETWHWVRIVAVSTYTKVPIQFEDSPMLSNKSEILFYPLQWTRVCLSKDSNTSLARLVVYGELLVEHEVKVKERPNDLNIVLGLYTDPKFGSTTEYTGQTTNLNIFSIALTVQEMKQDPG